MAMLVLAALAAASPAYAHGGHVHKIMGTVTVLQEGRVEVKTTDGKVETIVLDGKTKVLRGRAKLDAASIKVGDRVVVDVGDGAAPVTAREIRLGTPPAAAAKTR
jgi:hypothetical protein